VVYYYMDRMQSRILSGFNVSLHRRRKKGIEA